MNANEIKTVVSLKIAALVASGMDVAKAVDTVLGAGTYAKLAGEVYDALRK